MESRSRRSLSSSSDADVGTSKPVSAKKTPNDFIFGKIIGEGSYSTVYLAKEVNSGKEYAIKVLEKRHMIREKKQKYVMREKEVMAKLVGLPFFIQMFYTFQDADRLYFVLNYAMRGELLHYLHKLSSFDENCTRFYASEVVAALEHLYNLGIIHRDLKPENILLNHDMHIQITDFGSAKIVATDSGQTDTSQPENDRPGSRRHNSFVGTAQYVTPEVLTSKRSEFSSDLWALGCIIYQLLSGLPPFRGTHEYMIFQKIMKVEYEFPQGFSPVARDLVEKLLVLQPNERLGCVELGGFPPLKDHPFFAETDWVNLHLQKSPELLPYLPSIGSQPQLWGKYRTGFDDVRSGEIFVDHVISDEDRSSQLQEQAKNNKYHAFVENNLIIKHGFVDKRKGLFSRRRMLLLTEGPHLYYVDASNKVLKGQIPWSKELRTESKNFKIFFVHTPNRTYYLDCKEARADDWVNEINRVWQHYYGNHS